LSECQAQEAHARRVFDAQKKNAGVGGGDELHDGIISQILVGVRYAARQSRRQGLERGDTRAQSLLAQGDDSLRSHPQKSRR